jgi:5-methyltetrahydropteroyltriglutamate--homocysteine methyltransferase
MPGTWRAEVVGSLLRPRELVAARTELDSGDLTPAEFKAVEDAAVRTAIELQESAGIDVVTDGELRRYAFYGHLIDAFEGFDREGGWAIPFRDERGEQLILKRPVVVNRLRWKRSMCGEDFPSVGGTTPRQGDNAQRPASRGLLRPGKV